MKKILISVLLFTCFSCVYDSADNKLKIINSTKSDLYILDYDTSSLEDYPNELLNLERSFFLKDSIKIMWLHNETWEDYIKGARNHKLNLFVISPDTIKKYTKDEIINGEKYTKVLSYSLKEIEKMKWKVVVTE
jgi:hypothetical protein